MLPPPGVIRTPQQLRLIRTPQQLRLPMRHRLQLPMRQCSFLLEIDNLLVTAIFFAVAESARAFSVGSAVRPSARHRLDENTTITTATLARTRAHACRLLHALAIFVKQHVLLNSHTVAFSCASTEEARSVHFVIDHCSRSLSGSE